MAILPNALIFIAPGCSHCPVVLDALTRALKEGRLGRLEAVNLPAHPQEAERLGVRGVPWLRLGPFELTGALTPAEVRQWVARASEDSGWAEYAVHLIEQRQLDELLILVQQRPGALDDLLRLYADPTTAMATRIGISAVLEDLAGSPALERLAPQLQGLTLADSASLRADACHFLGLAGDARAIFAVERLLQDPNPEVREIAAETLALLRAASHAP